MAKPTYVDNLCSFLQNYTSRPMPSTLYRVQHAGSQAYFEGGNLKARSNVVPEDTDELCGRVMEHMKWIRSKAESCFISVFDDPWCAHAWAEQRARQRRSGEADVVLYEIDTMSLGKGLGGMVFHVDSLLTCMGINRPTLLKGQEYLILLGVPAKAIKYEQNITEPSLGGGVLKQIDLEACQHRLSHDHTHRQVCLTCASEVALERRMEERRLMILAPSPPTNGTTGSTVSNGGTNGTNGANGTNGSRVSQSRQGSGSESFSLDYFHIPHDSDTPERL